MTAFEITLLRLIFLGLRYWFSYNIDERLFIRKELENLNQKTENNYEPVRRTLES